jgi:serpin B
MTTLVQCRPVRALRGSRPRLRLGRLCMALGLVAVAAQGAAQAPQVAKGATAAAAAASAASAATISTDTRKDVAVDAVAPEAPVASGSAPAVGGRLVPTPGPAPRVAGTAGTFTTPTHDAATAASLADLGLALLQQQSRASGKAEVNAVVSPLSAASALGMVHAGAGGETGRELATLLSSSAAGQQGFASRLPSVLQRLAAMPGADSPFVMANRVWIRKDVVSAVPAPYAATVKARFNADAAVLSFDNGEAARRAINGWTSDQTRKRIPELLPAGSITPTTKVVVTNAIHFKSKWALPFDPKATEAKPFQAVSGTRLVPTMVDERAVLHGTVDNLSVMELPFANMAYSLLIAMAPSGHTLDALEKDLAGLDMAAWSSQLKASTCRLELPKFAIEAKAGSLKSALQALGVRTVFSDQADLSPLLGKAAAGTQVDDVYHSATIVIDEAGGEAAAATAATIQAKSFQRPAPACAVDRPFVFAVVHKGTGAPLFVGKVADPSPGGKTAN